MFVYSIVCNSLLIFESYSLLAARSLDLVLFLGDELYKSLNTQQYLSATDLPTNISVCNVQVQVSHLHNNYGMLLNNED